MTPSTTTRNLMTIALLTASVGGVGCVSRETIDNPLHCANNAGDALCGDLYPDGSRPYCSSGEGECALRYVSGTQRYCHENGACADVYDGCMANLPEGECYAPWGKEMSPEGSSSSGGGASSSETEGVTSGSSGTNEGSGETGPAPCGGHGDCGEVDAPLCVDGDCVACELGAAGDCAAKDPSAPVCDAGACVPCTVEDAGACGGTTPICDPELRECLPCKEHPQCPDSACSLVDGSCLPADSVLHVDADGGQDFMSIAAALGSVGAGDTAIVVLHERDMGLPYLETVVIDGGKTIALLAEVGESPSILGTGGNPALRVEGAGTVAYGEGLRLSNTMGSGVLVDGSSLWLDRSTIVQTSDEGARAQSDGELNLRNCFVSGPIDGDALVADGASMDVLYTTVGAGPVVVGQTHALFCENEASVNVRNSILLSLDDDPEVECVGATLVTSATEAEVGFDPTWFEDYVDGDFHLTASGVNVFANLGLWLDRDPSMDIDGDVRAESHVMEEHPGADLP